MSKENFRQLQDSISQLVSRLESREDEELDRPVCPIGNPRCDGYGNVVEDDGVRTCVCVHQARQQAIVAHADLPQRYKNATLETFKENTPSAKAALVNAREYVESYEPAEGRGLLIHGNTGSGKTHLAIAVFKALLANGYKGAYFNVTDLFDQIRRNMDANTPRTAADFLEERLNRKVLVLDDLGIQKSTAWVTDRLYAFINRRYEDCGTLIITSSLRPSELEQQMEPVIYSRIRGMCQEIELLGKDQRADIRSRKRQTDTGHPGKPRVSVQNSLRGE